MAGTTRAEDKKVKITSNSPILTEAQELNLDGTDGVWLPRSMADKVLSDVELIPKLELKITHLESALIKRSERMENFKLGMEEATKAREDAIKSQQLTEVKLEDAEARLHSWYRNPLVWIGVGLLVGVVVETSVVIAVNR
jgi:hypothetical protein